VAFPPHPVLYCRSSYTHLPAGVKPIAPPDGNQDRAPSVLSTRRPRAERCTTFSATPAVVRDTRFSATPCHHGVVMVATVQRAATQLGPSGPFPYYMDIPRPLFLLRGTHGAAPSPAALFRGNRFAQRRRPVFRCSMCRGASRSAAACRPMWWRESVDAHFPYSAWVTIRRDTLDELIPASKNPCHAPAPPGTIPTSLRSPLLDPRPVPGDSLVDSARSVLRGERPFTPIRMEFLAERPGCFLP